MNNYQLAMDLTGETMTSSSPVVSLANPTHQQESDLGKRTSDISSRRCLESFQRLSQPTSWAKMFMDSLIGTKAWSSKKCVLNWRVLGTQYNRYYCQLRASVRPTTECESGLLLKTPCAADAYSEAMSKKEQKFGHSGTLAQEVQSGFVYQRGLLPTPMAMNRNATVEQTQARQENFAAMGMLPTPTTRDHKGANSIEHMENQNGNKVNHMGQLPNYIKYHSGNDSHQLNPQFVAEMMGFPTDWTILPFLGGE